MFSSPLPKRIFLSLGLLLALQAGLQAQQTLRTAGDRPIDIQHIRLDLRVDIPKKTVDAKATINATALRKLPSFSLDAVGFKVKEVRRAEPGGKPAAIHFSQDARKLTIDCAPVWNPGEKATYEIDYQVKNPRTGLHFYSPTSSNPDVPSMVWSQGEAEDNRFWIPCLDHPNVKQTTEMFVTVAPGYDVLSNGKLVDKKENPADKTVTFHWLQDKPHASYLITLVVGQFDILETSWEGIPISYWVPKGLKETLEPTFGRTPEMIAFFSKRFGVRYPWDKYAQVVVEQFNFGGMENTSATTMNSFILVDKRGLVDGNAESVVSHELAHQWWGDLLTCRDWRHTWLNEGWASFAEVLWDEHSHGKDAGDWNLLQKGQSARSRAGNGGKPIVDHYYSTPLAMFDNRVYPKGAWVLHMLRRQMGEEAFWKGVTHYAEKNRLQSVETSDFRRAMEESSGQDLERFFYDWTERGGSPTLEVQATYDADHKQLKLVVKQTQKEDPFHLPLKVAFHLPGDAKPVTVEKLLTERASTFTIPLAAAPDFFEVDPNQDILAEIKETQPLQAWLAQLQRGINVASRVRAVRHLGTGKEDKKLVTDALVAALKAEPFWGVQQEIAGVLGRLGGPQAKEAFLANSESDKPRVRRVCIDQLARFKSEPDVAKRFRTILEKGDPSPAVEATALRAYAGVSDKDAVKLFSPWLEKPSLRDALCLAAIAGLTQTKDKDAFAPLLAHAKRGTTHTGRRAALSSLGEMAKAGWSAPEEKQLVVSAMTGCLDDQDLGAKRIAINVLGELGKTAATALPALNRVAEKDPDGNIKARAKNAAEKIRKDVENAAEAAKKAA